MTALRTWGLAGAVGLLCAVLAGPGSAGGPAPTGPRALFFGDSLFVGVGAAPQRPVQVRTATDLLGWRAVVDAVSGTGYTTGGRHGLPYAERLRTDGRLRSRYDVVVLEGGTNDAHHGSLTHLHDAALETVDLVRRSQPTARIVLVGAFVAHGVGPRERYVLVDRVLEQVASERGLLYVSQLRYSQVTDPGFLSADRFHPGAAGYREMGRDLAAALRARTSPTRPG